MFWRRSRMERTLLARLDVLTVLAMESVLMAKEVQAVIDELRTELDAMTSLVTANSATIDRLMTEVEARKDDAEELQAFVDQVRADRATLTEAAKRGTPSEDEPDDFSPSTM